MRAPKLLQRNCARREFKLRWCNRAPASVEAPFPRRRSPLARFFCHETHRRLRRRSGSDLPQLSVEFPRGLSCSTCGAYCRARMICLPKQSSRYAMTKLPDAVFLDRDGTVMEDAHYIKSPDQVRLIPGAGAAVKRINDAKVPAIVVTNQSGIARGIFKLEDYEAVRRHFESLLAAEGAHIDADR